MQRISHEVEKHDHASEELLSHMTPKQKEIYDLHSAIREGLDEGSAKAGYPTKQDTTRPELAEKWDTGAHLFIGGTMGVEINEDLEGHRVHTMANLSLRGSGLTLINLLSNILEEHDDLRAVMYKAINMVGENNPDKAYTPSDGEMAARMERVIKRLGGAAERMEELANEPAPNQSSSRKDNMLFGGGGK